MSGKVKNPAHRATTRSQVPGWEKVSGTRYQVPGASLKTKGKVNRYQLSGIRYQFKGKLQGREKQVSGIKGKKGTRY